MVGGGIAGLACAAALDPTRFEVTLYEAAPERITTGAALGIWPAARRALSRIGAWDKLGDLPPRLVHAGLFDLTGRRLATVPGPDLTLVERPRLMAALVASVPDSVARVTREVTDPAGLDADLVIGADGVRSTVRGLVAAGAADRVATPYVALRGLRALPQDPGVVGEYWGPGRLFGLAPVAGDRAYWFTTHRSAIGPEPLDVAAVLAQARTRYADAAPLICDTLAQAPPEATLATRMWLAPAMPRYVGGRYVVIGDAAHASLPNLGRGACDALLDAVTLADALNRGRPLTGWQARRLPPTQAARVTAGTLMRLALLDRGHRVRDRLLGALDRSRPGEGSASGPG